MKKSNNEPINESYLQFDKNNLTALNNAANCNEFEPFFEETSRIAPSQINLNDLDIDQS